MLIKGKKDIVSISTEVLHYIIAAILILNQNTIWRFLSGTSEKFPEYVTIALLVGISICLVITLIWNPSARNSRGFIAPSLILIYLAIHQLLSGFFPYYFLEFSVTVFAIGLYCLIGNDRAFPEVLKAYCNLMAIVAAVSVILWMLCSMFKIIPSTGTVLTSWSPEAGYTEINSFFGIYFEPQTVRFLGHRFIRNSAFFAEGPMASLAFTFGLLIELLLSKRPRLWKLIILFIGVFSTFSVTGIMICVAAIAAKLVVSVLIPAIRNIADKNKKRMVSGAIICVIVVALAFVVYIAAFRLGTDSASIRMDDYKSGLKAWLDAPILGNGFMNDYSIMNYMAAWRGENLGFSNSLTQVLAHCGLYIGILYILPIIVGAIRSIKHHKWNRLFFILCTFALICLAIFTYSYMLIFLLYYLAFGSMGSCEATSKTR